MNKAAYKEVLKDLETGWKPMLTKELLKGIAKSYKEIPLAELISSGNKKLPVDTAIFNMGPAANCPSEALGLCQAVNATGKNICYAKKAERLYPNVLPYRERQASFWEKTSALDFALQFILINAMKSRSFTALRVNESGDFYGQADVDKLDRIAKILASYGVCTYVYTARKDLDYMLVKTMIVNGSGFTAPGVTNDFKYIETREDLPKGYALCPGDCKICDRCQKYAKLTACIKH